MNKSTTSSWRYILFYLTIPFLIYLPGLPGGFIYDDYFNILQNNAINNSELNFSSAWLAAKSGSSGPLGRPFAMFSFYLNYQLSGFSPLSYKLFNISVHAFNTIIVFVIVKKILILLSRKQEEIFHNTKIKHLAFWITILWALHPIQLTAVLYVVQRMTSMAGTFTLLGIYYYLGLRSKKTQKISQVSSRLVLITIFGMLAALCKENGLLLFLFLFVIECFWFKWCANSPQELSCLKLFYFVVLFIPICLALVILLNGSLMASYEGREFNLQQRLLTEFRVLWFYIFQIILPQANLFGLHHDDFIISTSLFNPLTTFLSVLGFLILLFISIKYIKEYSWLVFGLVFFFAGHVMESTIFPLNLVHEHRNYLPSIGLLMIFVLLLNLIIRRLSFIGINILLLIITILFSVITMNRAYDWNNVILLGERLAQRHPDSITSNYEMGYTYSKLFEQTREPAFAYIAKKALKKADFLSKNNIRPAIALVHISSMLDEVEDQKRIEKISNYFRHRKVHVREVISLRQLVNCNVEGFCNTNDLALEALFENLLKNKSLVGRLKDDVLYIYATYLMTLPDGASKALTIMQEVASRNPKTLEYQVKLISMLLTNGNLKKATLLMEKLNESDGLKWNIIKNNSD